jgi:hypothetical protein
VGPGLCRDAGSVSALVVALTIRVQVPVLLGSRLAALLMIAAGLARLLALLAAALILLATLLATLLMVPPRLTGLLALLTTGLVLLSALLVATLVRVLVRHGRSSSSPASQQRRLGSAVPVELR